MAEIEIHHKTEVHDRLGKMIGVMVSVIGVLLAIVTIVSHRAHTESVLLKAEANNKWSYYQSKKIKFHNLELGEDLLTVLQPKGTDAAEVLIRYASEKARYEKEAAETQTEAREIEKHSSREEDRALRFDFGEGLLEVGLILTSLYFISKSTLFPAVGVLGALVGVAIAATGYLH